MYVCMSFIADQTIYPITMKLLEIVEYLSGMATGISILNIDTHGGPGAPQSTFKALNILFPL